MAEPGKTEKATPRRREEARKKGTVARSTELNSTLILLGLVMMLKLTAGSIYQALHEVVAGRFASLAAPLPVIDEIDVFAMGVILDVARVVAPIALTALMVGVLANFLQVGFLFTAQPLKPKATNINPVNGFKRLFSRRSCGRLHNRGRHGRHRPRWRNRRPGRSGRPGTALLRNHPGRPGSGRSLSR